jgi:flavin reductase (DIM6/NTAB) family NADH-FMN oxidoreductase RutF
MPDTTPPPVSGTVFREAMSRVAGAVHIVATDGPAGLGGATATAVTSVSDSPPSLLLCLNQQSQTLDRIRGNGVFSVNVLSGDQEEIAAVFSGARGVDGGARFQAGHGWRLGEGAPVLASALASFSCRLTVLTPVGGHVIAIGMVEQAVVGEALPPLLYHRRDYRRLAD